MAAVLTAMSSTALAQPAAVPMPSEDQRNWLVSGFAGANFDTTIDRPADIDVVDIDSTSSLEFGWQVGYLWRGVVGAEALVAFAPSMGAAGVVFSDKPNVYSYMANAIGSVPLGNGRYQPYVSGGFGAIQVLADVFNTIGNPLNGATSSNQVKFGGNIGGGVMAFSGRFGIRGDVRYYRAATDDDPVEAISADTIAQTVVSGLSFWRGNIGMVIRW
jgi:hypothetical protein